MHLVKGSGNSNDESEDFCSLVKRGPQGRFENMKFKKKINEKYFIVKMLIYIMISTFQIGEYPKIHNL